MDNAYDKKILKELRELTKDKNSWKSRISNVASLLNENHSVEIKAKALWMLGEMGLKHPDEIKDYVSDIASYLDSKDSKLRQRAANAIGRIGRSDTDLIIDYMDNLMKLRYDESGDVRHAFIWAAENIATNDPELFSKKLDIFYDMISDSNDKVRIEAPEMFRVIGKRKPECVRPWLEKLEDYAENDENPTVRIHSAGAIRITKKALENRN